MKSTNICRICDALGIQTKADGGLLTDRHGRKIIVCKGCAAEDARAQLRGLAKQSSPLRHLDEPTFDGRAYNVDVAALREKPTDGRGNTW